MPAARIDLVRLLDRLFYGIALSVGVVVIVTVLVISYGVVAREVFHLSDVWVTDLTTYLMGYMTFVGSAALAWQGRHVKIDVLGHFLGPAARRVLAVVSCVVVTCVALLLLWLNANFWWDAWDSNERSWGMLSLPLWIPYLSLFGGGVLLAVAQVVRLVLLLRGSDGAPMRDGPGDRVAER
jgi:TRAP-type C4-dicarboxylate transport system permease small subunit